MTLFHRLRKADNIQSPNDPVIAAAEYADAAIAADLQQAFAELGKQIDPEALKRAIAARNLTAILDLVPREQLTEDLAAALTRLVDVAQETAQLAAKALEDRTVMRIAFDPLAPTFTQLMVDMRTNLVQGMTSDAQAALQAIIVDGYQRGIGVDAIARNVRDIISLGEQRAQAVLSYRRALEQGNGRALTYDLRDSRFDGTISRALDGGVDIPTDKIDRMVARYAERQLASRARTIARTEALRAANIGQRAGYQQFVDKGLVDRDGVTVRWLVAMDEATCEICQSIPDMNPDGVGWGEDFDSIDGPVSMPPDPHPNCRCSLTYHIAANAIAKGYNPDEARDEHGRWTDGGISVNEEKNKPRIVSSKQMQEAVLRNTWAQHGRDLDYDDVLSTSKGDALWNTEVERWNATHGTSMNPDHMDMGLTGPNGDFLRHFERKYLEGKKAPFPGVKAANEFFEDNDEWQHTAYLPGNVPSEAPK